LESSVSGRNQPAHGCSERQCRGADLDVEVKTFEGTPVRVVTPRMLWRMKKGTMRPTDRFDADVLAERFGFRED